MIAANDPAAVDDDLLTAYRVERRGWTRKLIETLLGEPDEFRTNPNEPNAPRKMRMYRRSRVLAAEKTQGWLDRCRPPMPPVERRLTMHELELQSAGEIIAQFDPLRACALCDAAAMAEVERKANEAHEALVCRPTSSVSAREFRHLRDRAKRIVAAHEGFHGPPATLTVTMRSGKTTTFAAPLNFCITYHDRIFAEMEGRNPRRKEPFVVVSYGGKTASFRVDQIAFVEYAPALAGASKEQT